MGDQTLPAEPRSDRQAPDMQRQQPSHSQSSQGGSASGEQPGDEGEEGRQSKDAGVPSSHQPQQQHPSLTGSSTVSMMMHVFVNMLML